MIKYRIALFSQAFLFAFSSLSSAQKVIERPAKEKINTDITQAEIFKQASKIANEDLSDLKHPIKPMLWKVEGKDLKKASYLFGSIHVADENIITLHPDVEAAYKQADSIATEVNMGLISQLRSSKLMMREDEKTLKESIGEELYAELNAQLAGIAPGLNAQQFDDMKTWAVMLIYSMIEDAMKGGEFLDIQLWKRAGNDNKKRWALETSAQQLGGFDQLSDEEQKILLKDSLFSTKLLKKEKINAITMLKNLYLKGNINEMHSILDLLGNIEGTNEKVANKFEKLLLSERNDRMTARILKTFTEMPDKSHFIVAGALHYIGEHNVVDLLRKKGYKVTKQ